MRPKTRKTLVLARETLRMLTEAQQRGVAGGDPPRTFFTACDTKNGCESATQGNQVCCCDSILLCNSKLLNCERH